MEMHYDITQNDKNEFVIFDKLTKQEICTCKTVGTASTCIRALEAAKQWKEFIAVVS